MVRVVDFGLVVPDKTFEKGFVVSNEGSKPAAFEASTTAAAVEHSENEEEHIEKVTVRVKPQKGVLGAKGSESDKEPLRLEFKSSEVGVFQNQVKVKVDDGQPDRTVEVLATVLPQHLDILSDKGAPLKVLDFGPVYYGRTLKKSILVSNNSPETLSFDARVGVNDPNHPMAMIGGDSQSQTQSQHRSNKDETQREPGPADEFVPVRTNDRTYEVASLGGGGGGGGGGEGEEGLGGGRGGAVGSIPPFSQYPLEVTFRPFKRVPDKGFKVTELTPAQEVQEFQYLLLIRFISAKRHLALRLKGIGTRSKIRLEPRTVDFGEVNVYDHAESVVMVKNGCRDLPIRYLFERSGSFHVMPMIGSLAPGQSRAVLVSFTPRVLGRHSRALQAYAKAIDSKRSDPPLHSTSLMLYGDAPFIGEKIKPPWQLNKVKEDFFLPPKYISEENVAVRRRTVNLKDVLRKRFKRRELWELHVGEQMPLAGYPQFMLSDDALKKRKANSFQEGARVSFQEGATGGEGILLALGDWSAAIS
ncbi:hypothetical protein CBR_g24232 [Chara braunii]|uniref:HYDIN/VesB/CFA65-like Ig-like domain-containing protein n=1 Tax=Chara braunii TaxID=69332 RepID=A0A388L672_CHABU|nr:hypothetical protein CBR_g24232 [Chara braunii]|eukprot:GBG77784.1 hypothetical protein CBR_g24232 [Chara braunii]